MWQDRIRKVGEIYFYSFINIYFKIQPEKNFLRLGMMSDDVIDVYILGDLQSK